MIRESQRVQWWLAELDQHDNVRVMVDGAHNDISAVLRAHETILNINSRYHGKKFAAVRCNVHDLENKANKPPQSQAQWVAWLHLERPDRICIMRGDDYREIGWDEFVKLSVDADMDASAAIEWANRLQILSDKMTELYDEIRKAER